MQVCRRIWLIALIAVVCSGFLSGTGGVVFAKAQQDEREDGFFELFDEAGNILTRTGRILGVGDGYIEADNRYYVVERIDGDKIITKFKETIELPEVELEAQAPTQGTLLARWWIRARQLAADLVQSQGRGKGDSDNRDTKVAIYATHSDESYVPTSGTASEEEGDILDVAKALGKALEDLGYTVQISDNSHLPRDGEVYLRSRRTASQLLQQYQPDTIIDVHRDAVPAEVYETTVNGKEMVKVRLVVGKQNQNREAIMEYAKRIKSVADKQFPGLVDGILHAQGNYNQDLSPKAILMEFGTHLTSKDKAEAAARLMARVLPAAAGFSGGRSTQSSVQRDEDRSAGSSLWWMLGVGVALAVGLIVLNNTRAKHVKGFVSKEFSDAGPEDSTEGDGSDGV